MGGGLGGFLQRVEGAGADIAVDDAKGADRCCCRKLRWNGRRLRLAYCVTGAPIGIAPAGSAEGRDQLPVCDETSQIAMGFRMSRKVRSSTACGQRERRKSIRSSGGIPRISNQSNLAAIEDQVGGACAVTGCGRRSRGGLPAPSSWSRRRAGRKPRNSARPAASNPCRRCGCPGGHPWQAPADAGFDLGGKTGQNGQRGGDERGNSDCGKCLDHDGPLSWALRPRRFVGWMCNQRKFPDVFAKAENGFVRAEFCFVVHWRTKHCRLAQGRRAGPMTVSLADPK